MESIPARLRRRVIRRANNRCEYCGLAQIGQEASFHIDHITPESMGGPTSEENLALACISCSLRKGARQSGLDSETGERVALFHPRRDDWNTHFRWDGFTIVGLTPKGRATVKLLRLNRPSIHAIRQEEAYRGRHPP
jgi:hypothetical protein